MIRTRDSGSYAIAKKYNSNVVEAKDFAYDVLQKCDIKKQKNSKVVVNCNPYIRSHKTKQRILRYTDTHNKKWQTIWYIPAEIWIDDIFFDDLLKENPEFKLYDRTKHSLTHTINILANSAYWIGARLHFLLLLDHYGVSYEPLIYQEKITKVLLNK